MKKNKLLSNNKKTRIYILDILKQHLINYNAKILFHPDKNLIGLSGLIINESKSMISIKQNNHIIKVQKKYAIFLIMTNDLNFMVSGNILVGTSKYRKKKKYRFW